MDHVFKKKDFRGFKGPSGSPALSECWVTDAEYGSDLI